jgi:hypothetical protein
LIRTKLGQTLNFVDDTATSSVHSPYAGEGINQLTLTLYQLKTQDVLS